MSKKTEITGIAAKQKELAIAAREAQEKIRAAMFKHGMRKKISLKTGLSTYKIREAILSDNPDLDNLAKIEKALSKAA